MAPSTAGGSHGDSHGAMYTTRSWRREIDDQEPAIRLPSTSGGSESLAERVRARL